MDKFANKVGVKVPEILLPQKGTDMTKWAVVACDQYTSQPEYWAETERIVGDAPSTLRLMLPEMYLEKPGEAERIEKINATMKQYLDSGILENIGQGLMYVERRAGANTRHGLIVALDLECYDYTKGSTTLIRATEGTIVERIPPRLRIRKDAPVELPHILVLIDDPERTVIEPIGESVGDADKRYDFELMQNGGHISGWLVGDNASLENAFARLEDPHELYEKYGAVENPIIFAMGDGNHSFAAAKKHWESVKSKLSESEWADCPARHALAELVNIHDEAISFEPIHKVIFDTEPRSFISEAKSFFAENAGDGRSFTLITAAGSESISVSGMSIGELIDRCEGFCREYIARHGGRIDYIHGDDECKAMSEREGCAGILLPRMEKSELFKSVMSSGPFPKKSFSIGVGRDKRYYLECRRIK